jgi:hypothetical protein
MAIAGIICPVPIGAAATAAAGAGSVQGLVVIPTVIAVAANSAIPSATAGVASVVQT